jgi:hypothetical protein
MARVLQDVTVDEGLRALIEPRRLEALVNEHRTGEKDHAELLWGLVNLGLWRQTYRV